MICFNEHFYTGNKDDEMYFYTTEAFYGGPVPKHFNCNSHTVAFSCHASRIRLRDIKDAALSEKKNNNKKHNKQTKK